MKEQLPSNELTDAVRIANRLLDEPYCCPDDDLRILSRQFLRLHERVAVEPKKELDEHDAGIIKDLEAMAANQLAGFWPQVLAIGALRLIRREHSPGEVANSQKPSAAVDGIHQHRLSKPETLGVVDQPPGECSVSPPSVESFQDRVRPWLDECFGEEVARNTVERNHRFLEEALELVQSLGCTWEDARKLVDYVFSRDVGEPNQELGGVMVTLAALSLANSLSMNVAAETELARVWQKMDVIRAKQARKLKNSALPGSTVTNEKESSRERVAPCVRELAERGATQPPKTDIEALLDSFVWAVRRDNDAGDQYTRQEVKDVRAELLAAIRATVPPRDVHAKLREAQERIPWAWSIIANVSGGDWSKQSQDWQDAAAQWEQIGDPYEGLASRDSTTVTKSVAPIDNSDGAYFAGGGNPHG
jgi:hypothetical protein